jgi:hypothetical protein
MSKKFVFFVSIISLFVAAGSAQAQPEFEARASWWSDLGSGHLWSEPNNWWTMDMYWDESAGEYVYVKVEPNQVPDVNVRAYIGKADAHVPYPRVLHDLVDGGYKMVDPIIDGTVTAEPNLLFCSGGYALEPNQPGSVLDPNVYHWDPCTDHYITVTGGTLTVGTPQTWEGYDYIWGNGYFPGQWGPSRMLIGCVGNRGTGGSGTMTVSGGTVNVGGHIELGSWENSDGDLIITGGTINIVNGLYCSGAPWGSDGHVDLHGGTINANTFYINNYYDSVGSIDVTQGRMILNQNVVDRLNDYASGSDPTAVLTTHGTTHGQITGGNRAAVSIDWDVSNEEKTTVSASLTDPNQAWAPSPPDLAGNVRGPSASVARPILSWSAGNNATQHAVYFGSSFTDVNNANTSTVGVYRGTQPVADVNWQVPTNLAVQQTYYWRIDENPGPTKGVVWTFTVANLAKAAQPYPMDGAIEVSAFVKLSWSPGIYATSHKVYLSTDFNDVNDRLITPASVTTNSYTPPSPLTFDTTYYWRVDEVAGPNTWPASVWSFTTDTHHTVDDYNAYANSDAMKATWNDYWYGGPAYQNHGYVYLNTDDNFSRDGNSMRFTYENATAHKGTYYGSWAEATVTNLHEMGAAWNASGAKAIRLWFYGQAGNSKTAYDRLYIKLTDGSAVTGAVRLPDMNDVAEAEWHEWRIELADPGFAAVNKGNISKVTIGFGGAAGGGGNKAGGTGMVYFDEFEVWPPYCRSEVAYPYGDLTGDCDTDEEDLRIMADDWLMADYNTLGYTGTLMGFPGSGEPNYDDCWVSGVVDANTALYFNLDDPDPCDPFNPGDDYVKIPPLNLYSNTVSFTCWAKRHGLQRDDAGLFFCSWREDGPGTTESGFVIGLNNRDNGLNYNWKNTNTTYNWNPPNVPILPDDAWAFCALTVAPSSARIYMRRASDYLTTLYYDDNVTSHPTEAFEIPSRIGDHKLRRFVGTIDDFRIYNKTLNYDEVRWLATGGAYGTNPTDANLYAHYKFDDATGLTALDDAGDMLNYWPVPSPANYVDPEPQYQRYVNFRDFVVIANNWLQETLWP